VNLSPLASLVLLAGVGGACGIGNAPAAAPAEPAAAPAPAIPAAAPTVAAVATPEPVAAPAVTAEPTAAPAAATDPPAPAATASDEEAPPPPSAEQKAFVTSPLLGTDVVFITVADASQTCASVGSKASPPKGARRADLRVLWKTGYYDLSNRMAEAKLGTYQGTFWLKEDATQGGIQVRVAPTQQGGTGRIHVKATRPGSAQAIDAELEVTVCADVEPKKRARPDP
jgi:hypothetical protein